MLVPSSVRRSVGKQWDNDWTIAEADAFARHASGSTVHIIFYFLVRVRNSTSLQVECSTTNTSIPNRNNWGIATMNE